MNSTDMNVEGSQRTDLSLSMEKANVYSLAFAIPLAALLVILYILRWDVEMFSTGFSSLFANFLIFAVVFFPGVILHELIHALAWMIFGQKSASVIKFGFQLKTFSPYAHCMEPMRVNAYRIGAAMPGILLGIIPALIGILNGNGWLLGFGALFTAAAGGDFLILWLTRNVDSDKLVEDHPSRVGCYILGGASSQPDLK